MQTGVIIKSNSGYYDIALIKNKEIITATSRGVLRHKQLQPLVGDYVTVNKENDTYIIEKIHGRKNELIRPKIVNIDIALVVISVALPKFQHFLLDKFIAVLEYNNIEPIIIFSKFDLLTAKEAVQFQEIITYYQLIGYQVFTQSLTVIDKKAELQMLLSDKVATVMGQTGVGKSTFLNAFSDNKWDIATNEISLSLGRGKHTTRIVELYDFGNYWLADTPGFSSFQLTKIDKKLLTNSFIEFSQYRCKFNDCVHLNEIGCGVGNNISTKKMLAKRYENYVKLYNELANEPIIY